MFAQLDGKNDRSAQFVCVLALILPNGKLIYAKGETKGKISLKEEGINGLKSQSVCKILSKNYTVVKIFTIER